MKTFSLIASILFLASCGQGTQTQFATGATGPQGPAGGNGSTVTFVQLCPGVQTSYPSSFPEVAECVDGNLYGVYSANGGYLFEIPPGVYTSNAIGSTCTVTVGTNCQIDPPQVVIR